jgi:hypothetical protein
MCLYGVVFNFFDFSFFLDMSLVIAVCHDCGVFPSVMAAFVKLPLPAQASAYRLPLPVFCYLQVSYFLCLGKNEHELLHPPAVYVRFWLEWNSKVV